MVRLFCSIWILVFFLVVAKLHFTALSCGVSYSALVCYVWSNEVNCHNLDHFAGLIRINRAYLRCLGLVFVHFLWRNFSHTLRNLVACLDFFPKRVSEVHYNFVHRIDLLLEVLLWY